MLKKQTTMSRLKEDMKFIGGVVNRVTGANPFSGDRTRDNVDARFILCKLTRDFLGAPYNRIGKVLKRDHATMMYACKQAISLAEADKEFRRNYSTCLKIITDTDLGKGKIGDVNIIDVVELKGLLNDMTKKYDELLSNIEMNSWDLIRENFLGIENSVLRGVMNDRNCSYQLNRTLKKILVNKTK